MLGRLTAAVAPIAMLVVGSQAYGSLGVGARLAAIVSISMALAAPLQARRLDRRGVSRGLRAALWQGTVAGLAMALVVHRRIEVPWTELVAIGLGISLAVIPTGFRALLTHLVDEGTLSRASNVDAVGFEISLIAAPLVVAAVAALSQPSVIFLVGAVLTAVGAVTIPPGGSAVDGPTALPWRRIPAPRVMTAALVVGLSGGLLEPAVFARVEDIGRSESLAALLLAVIGVGSALGGMFTSVRPPPATPSVAARFLMLHGIAVAAAAFGQQAWILVLWLFLAGAPIAPMMAVGATLLDGRVPIGERSTALAIAGSAIALGAGIGQALAGLAISHGATSATFGAAAAVAVATAFVAGSVHRRR